MNLPLIAIDLVISVMAYLAWLATVMVKDSFLRAAMIIEQCQQSIEPTSADPNCGARAAEVAPTAGPARWTALDDRQLVRHLDAAAR